MIQITVYICWNNGDPGQPYIGSLTAGNYFGSKLATELQRVLNLMVNETFTVEHDSNTNTLEIYGVSGIHGAETYVIMLADTEI